MKDSELKQFLTLDIGNNPVTPTTFIPPGWFHAIDSLIQCPRDDLNHFHLTWEIMELSRVGYDELFISGSVMYRRNEINDGRECDVAGNESCIRDRKSTRL